MSPSVLFRTIFFLLLLFVVVYIGTENTQTITFNFPLVLDKPARTSASLVYFAVFAVGVIAGTLFNADASKSPARNESDSSAKKKK
jgi:uncharacterized membrane protein YciS (DUF1049 family)